jgi:predicted dehydrogenase
MIQAGLAGAGPIWNRYQSVLPQLRRPLHVVAVFDNTPARAENGSVASVTGLQALARRADVQAILLMNAGWMGMTGLDLLTTGDKSVLVADWIDADRSRYEQIHHRAAEAGATVMPAMWRRYMPASIRLQELIATDLGPPQLIELAVTRPPERSSGHHALEPLIGWIDYCRNLFRSFPESASLDRDRGESPGASLRILYSTRPGDATSDGRREAIIRISGNADEPASNLSAHESLPSIPRISVTCDGGSAEIVNRGELKWRVDDGPVQTECLAAERSEEEIMLDLFCRRVVGGLIPVADFNDAVQAMRIIEQTGILDSPHAPQ